MPEFQFQRINLPDLDISGHLLPGGALNIWDAPECWEREAHAQRYRWACSSLEYPCRVLDFGCGSGWGSSLLSNLHRVIGVDDSQQSKVTGWALGLFVMHTIPNSKVDAVIAFEVLEHLPDPAQTLEELQYMTHPEHLFASTPIIPTVGINPHHRQDFTESSFRSLLETSGWSIKEYGFQYRPNDIRPTYMVVRCERAAT